MKQPGKAKSAVTNDKELWLVLDEVAVFIGSCGDLEKLPPGVEALLEAVFDAQLYVKKPRKPAAQPPHAIGVAL